MKELTVVLHSGLFHAHDVFVVALLNLFGYRVSVKRTRNQGEIEKLHAKGAWVVDVGRKMDIENRWVDHHVLERGVMPTLEQMFVFLPGMNILPGGDIEKLLLDITAIDSGLDGIDMISSTISNYNPNWSSDADHDDRFQEAVELATRQLQLLKENDDAAIAADSIFKKVVSEQGHLEIIVLEQFAPIMKKLGEELPDLKFICYPDLTPGQWRVVTVKDDDGSSFGVDRIRIEKQDVENVDDLVFRHNGGFIAGAYSLEGVVKIAENAIARDKAEGKQF